MSVASVVTSVSAYAQTISTQVSRRVTQQAAPPVEVQPVAPAPVPLPTPSPTPAYPTILPPPPAPITAPAIWALTTGG